MRKIGKRRFVLVQGLLIYGVSVFLVWTIVFSIQLQGWLSPLDLVEILGPSLLFGLAYGLVTWRTYEKKCNRLTGVGGEHLDPTRNLR